MERLRLFAGLGLIAFILGCGVLMSIFLLKESAATISQTEWQASQQTLAELVKRANAPTQPPLVTVSEAPTPAASSSANGARIPINQATAQELDNLPGIGAVRAKAILDARSAGGPFADLDDLHARVPKLPQSVLEEMSDKITFK